MPGEFGSLVRDSLHEVAVRAEGVCVMVDHPMSGSIEAGREPLLGEGHPNRVGDALTQRAGGGLYSWSLSVFRVSGCPAPPLTEVLDLG